MNDIERKYKLVDILVSYAPQTVDTMKLVNELSGSEHTVRDLVGNLYDGLAYGNWPWVIVKRYNK